MVYQSQETKQQEKQINNLEEKNLPPPLTSESTNGSMKIVQ